MAVILKTVFSGWDSYLGMFKVTAPCLADELLRRAELGVRGKATGAFGKPGDFPGDEESMYAKPFIFLNGYGDSSMCWDMQLREIKIE